MASAQLINMEMKDFLIPCNPNKNVQDLLLEYLEENDVDELENLLEEGKVDVNYIYKDTSDFRFEEKNALQIACIYFDDINHKCIQLLLNYGADILYEDPLSTENSLHFSAESGNYKILETILQHIHKNHIDISNSDVIYTIIKYVKNAEKTEESYLDILKLLLETDIDINYQHVTSGWTAIYIAAKYGFKKFVQAIIDMRKNEINLDEFKDRNKLSARDLISNKNLYKGELPPIIEENSNITICTLYKNIRNRSSDDFTQNYDSIESTLNDTDKYSLLVMAVKYRLERVVDHLLNNNVKFEKSNITKEENPFVMTARSGYFKILKLFLRKKPNSELLSQALFELLKTSYTSEQTENINHKKCLTMLLKSPNLEINAKDYNENSAVHYALKYQDPEMALAILRKGATLASKDSFNQLAISNIDSTTLEAHLNDCIRYENEENSKNEDACLIINFTSLLSVETNKLSSDNKFKSIPTDLESQKSGENSNETELFVPETEVLQYMCTSQELKQLLKHPVILAFLYLKWHRIAKFFYINLFLYVLFILSLLSYITFGYNTKSESQQGIIFVSYGILFSTFILLVIREISQVIIYKIRYFFTFENWLEIVLLIATTGILSEHSNEIMMRQFSAIAIVAAAIEFLLLVGQFPSMSTNIMMLRTVSYTFFKLLLWYSILLFAFAYSFYTLFQETDEDSPTNSTVNADEEEQDFFEDPGMSLLKTIIMLTGEFDAGTIKFNTYPIISHLIFVMFVFLIAIVLFNLLNGLAVSDTQIIKNDAELYGQMLRVEHIAHIERVLLSNRIIHWMPTIKKVCLFPLNIKKAEVLVYLNQNAKVLSLEEKYNSVESKIHCFKVFFGTYFDKKIERALRLLMKEKKEEVYKRKKDDQLLTEIAELRSLVRTLIKEK